MTAPRVPTEPRGTATPAPPPTRPPPPPPLRCWACDGAATPASASASTAVRIDLVIGHLPVYLALFATLLPTTEVEFGPKTSACYVFVLQLSPATVAFCVFRTAVALIKRYLRVLAHKTFSGFDPVFEVSHDQLIGHFAFLLPSFD